jgi:pyruvate carboxylase
VTKFYCIVSDIHNLANPDTYQLLKEAVEKKGLEFVTLDALTQPVNNFEIETDAILYRLGLTSAAVFLEASIIKPTTSTFYQEYTGPLVRAFHWGDTLTMQKAGLPIIPTRFRICDDSDDTLQSTVQNWGGFPVVVKGWGGSHGSAVKSASSIEEIRQIINDNARKEDVVLRKFIHDARHIRVVVIGDRAFDAIEYIPQPNDFRTNAVPIPQVKAFDMTSDTALIETAERAVRATGIEFGGVDILIQPDGQHYIAEINFPCNFARNQLNTGADVAGAMVEYLVKKSQASV